MVLTLLCPSSSVFAQLLPLLANSNPDILSAAKLAAERNRLPRDLSAAPRWRLGHLTSHMGQCGVLHTPTCAARPSVEQQ